MSETPDSIANIEPPNAGDSAAWTTVNTPPRRKWRIVIGILILIAAALACFFYLYGGASKDTRESALALMPADARAVIFGEAGALRRSPFLEALYRWAPHPPADADYTQFVAATGFNYERDLDRVAIATEKRGGSPSFFAVADGRFDRDKIAAYAARNGTRSKEGGREIFRVQPSDGSRAILFTFLSHSRIALTDDVSLLPYLAKPADVFDKTRWNARFERLAGSPVFAVIRQEDGAAASLPDAPGGFRSPQLAALLGQLQWITLAGKPDGGNLRVVAEGDCPSDAASRQLSEFLQGLVTLAETGLNDPKLRQQLPPDVRENYLRLLQSADISTIGRGETQSVRVVLTVTPALLESAQASLAPASAIPAAPAEPPAKRSTRQRSGSAHK
jgi:hypothetical protein